VFALCDPAARPEETPAGAALTVPIGGTMTVELHLDAQLAVGLFVQLDVLRCDVLGEMPA
jgi:hypothetical protein